LHSIININKNKNMVTNEKKIEILENIKKSIIKDLKDINKKIEELKAKTGVVYYIDEKSGVQVPLFFVENVPENMELEEFEKLIRDAVIKEAGTIDSKSLKFSIGFKGLSNFVKAVYFEGGAWTNAQKITKVVYHFNDIKKRIEAFKKAA